MTTKNTLSLEELESLYQECESILEKTNHIVHHRMLDDLQCEVGGVGLKLKGKIDINLSGVEAGNINKDLLYYNDLIEKKQRLHDSLYNEIKKNLDDNDRNYDYELNMIKDSVYAKQIDILTAMKVCLESDVVAENNNSIQELEKLAEQGDAKAQTLLGNCFMYGDGVGQNYLMAVKWYKKAANQAFSEAQFYLGHMYAHGLGVPQSDEKALELFKKAAEQVHKAAQEKLKNKK